MGGETRARSRAVESAAKQLDGRACARDARFSSPRHPDAGLRQQHPPDGQGEGVNDAFDFPGFVPAYIRPLFCRGIGPFRWAALSGDPEDIFKTDAKVKELMPDNKHLHHWLDMAQRASRSRACRRASAGSASATVIVSGLPSTRWWRAAS